MIVQQIKNNIDKLTTNPNISILQSKEEFDNSRCSLDNPILINEEVDYQKEIFSKLKFQYLEQETRDKFLRKISDNSGNEIGRQDVDNIAMEAGEKKQQLKRLKIDLASKIRNLEEIIEENITLNNEMNDKKKSCDKYIDEIETMEIRLNDLIEGSTPDKREIINSIDVDEVNNVSNLKDDSSARLEREKIKLKRLNNELNLRKQMMEDQEQYLHELNEKSNKLDQSLNNVEPYETPSRSQILAKWCKEMNEILTKFTSVDELHVSILGEGNEQVYELILQTGRDSLKISFSKDLKITSWSNNKYIDQIKKINSSNSSTIEDLTNKLANLINYIIKQST